jgi:hypothetical protein
VWQDAWVKGKSFGFRRQGGHRTLEEKDQILREYRSSGLSLLAFAREQGLCYASLLRWRARRLPRPTLGQTQANPRFVPVTIEGDGLGGEYVVSWPGGRCLKIPLQFDPESLRRLLDVMEGHP